MQFNTISARSLPLVTSENQNYYILADGKKFADIEVKRTMFFKIIYTHYYWKALLNE